MGKLIERQRYLLDFTLSSLFRKKGRNASLFLVYTLVVFVLASAVFFSHAVTREAAIILKEAPEMIIQRSVAGRHDLIPMEYLERIRKIKAVSSARGRLWGYYYDPVVGANYTLMVPEAFGHAPGSIVIGAGISRIRLAYPGDDLEFMAFDGSQMNLQIQGIMPAETELVSSDLILVSEDDYRRLFGISKEYATDLVVRVRTPSELTGVASKVSELLPDTRVILREEILKTYDGIFSWRGGIMIFLFAGGLLTFLICAWDKASGFGQEEKREIGILKATGWETSDVILMKFWEGLVISLPAFTAGIIFAYYHVFFTNSALFEPILKGWAVLYPVIKLIPFIDPLQVVILFVLTVIPCTVATIIPSWAAAAIDPDTIMRA